MAVALPLNASAAELAHWNIYGELPPKPDIPPNFMRRIVLWLESNETPLVRKIAACVATLLASLAIGILFGQPFFVTAVVCAGIGGWLEKEKYTLKKEQLQKQQAAALSVANAAAAFNSFIDVQEMFGGEQRWNQLPVLNREDLVGEMGHLGLDLRVQDLPHPIMRGTDIHGRPFVSLKLIPRAPVFPGDDRPEVLTYFQRYVGKREWAFTFSRLFDTFGLQQLLAGNHPRYVLAD